MHAEVLSSVLGASFLFALLIHLNFYGTNQTSVFYCLIELAKMSTNWLSDASSDRGMASLSKKFHSRYSFLQGENAVRAKKIPSRQIMAYMPLKDSSHSSSKLLGTNSLTAYDEKCLEGQEPPKRSRFTATLPWLAHALLLLIALSLFYGSARNNGRAGFSCVELQSAFCT